MSKQLSKSRVIRSLRSGQITIPADFRKALGIQDHSLLQITIDQGELRIRPITPDTDAGPNDWFLRLYDYYAPVRAEAAKYSEEEINAAIDEAVRAVRARNA